MRHHVALSAVALAMPLSGCATFSFAPPAIETTNKLAAMRDTAGGCTPTTFKAGDAVTQIKPDVIGATDLINNYVLTYGCAVSELANGRQVFEVPAFLAAVTGLVGGSLGLNEDAVITTGVAAAVLKSGNGYYVPKEKAALVTTALRATLCVKTEAVGIDFFKTSDDSQGGPRPANSGGADTAALNALRSLALEQQVAQRAEALGVKPDPKAIKEIQDSIRAINAQLTARVLTSPPPGDTIEVSISVERQYFEMVGTALYSIHSILGERLGRSGSTDTTEIFNELKKLAGESSETTQNLKTAQTNFDNARDSAVNIASTQPGFAAAQALAQRTQEEVVRLKIKDLRIKLQACVLQARAT